MRKLEDCRGDKYHKNIKNRTIKLGKTLGKDKGNNYDFIYLIECICYKILEKLKKYIFKELKIISKYTKK